MINRRKAREYAFTLLFACRFQPDCVGEMTDRFLEENPSGDQEEYIRTVVEGVFAHEKEIDDVIARYAKGWTTERISNVCMALMRLSVYEICYMDSIPAAVSVNEAVALAKTFEGEESVSFVNGVLGRIKDARA